jgi:competence protein ComEC
MLLVEFFADIPFAALKTFTPTVFDIGCYYVLAGSLLYWIAAEPGATDSENNQFQPSSVDYHKSPAKKKPGRHTRLLAFIKGLIGAGVRRLIRQKAFGKPHNIAGTLVFIVLLVLAADAGYWYYSRFWNNDLKVTFIDVGQGNAALLELPRGYTMLIDGGGFSDNSIFDMGARVLAPLLWRKKIKSIDTLILTHPNSDHMNGLIYIAEHFNVRQIWTNNEDRNTFGYRTLMNVIAQEDITVPKFENLARQQMINGVALNILYPQVDFLNKKAADKWRNSNNNSLVVFFSISGRYYDRGRKRAGSHISSEFVQHGPVGAASRESVLQYDTVSG